MDIKKLLQALSFTLKDNAIWVYFKKYHDNTIIEIDIEKNIIHFGGKIKIYDKEQQNITKPEDRVVIECVDRLLMKWYTSEDIVLENVWKTWHGTSGRIDILVMKENKSFLMIECKNRGSEFEKEFKNMQKDWWQLFTYFQQDKNAEFLMLYTSHFDGKAIEYKNEIIKIEESYKETSNVKDLYARWNKFTKQNGIFDEWVKPYNFESKALTRKDLVKIKQADSSIIFNRFLEILRHNTVSDKPNAFNKMFTLFLCKIHDEWTKWENEEWDFQFKEWIDTDITFQTRLTDLYKRWMMEFLSKEITDFNDADFNNEFGDIDVNVRNRILEKITKLRLQKNNEFAIKEVFDEDTFADNAKVLKEVVELLQVYQIRYAEKQPFLWDFFELLLTTGLKQESGQFFTPVPIARFICKSIPLDRIVSAKLQAWDATDLLPTTIDYAAGSGHFLTESMEEIQNIIHTIDETTLKPNVAKEIKKWKWATFDWAGEYMYGIEKDYRLVKTAKVGCYLHGDGVATVIHGDGLDSFEFSKSYKHKLKKFNPDDKQENAQFDLVLSNPPYSVSAFKGNLDSDKAIKDFDLFDGLSDRSSEIECLFIERTKQLLKEWWIAALVLPSSILSNSGIYTKAREIILRNFDIISIVSLGSGTFMATGTNTVTVFMKKRNKYFARNLEASINTFFTNLVDVSLNGIEQVFSKYATEIRWVSFDDFKTLCQKSPNDTIKNSELFKDYSNKLKLNKNDNICDQIIQIEKEKILYFVLSYNQKVVLVKSWEKQTEKEFLWYEFSTRKWSEGIRSIQWWKSIDECTKLFDPDISDNERKVSTYIYEWFNNKHDREIHPELVQHVSRTRLVDLIIFDRVEFEKTISTNVKKKTLVVNSRWEIVKLNDILEILESWNRPKWWVSEYKEWIPSLWWEHIGLDGKIKLNDNIIKFVPSDFFDKSEKGILNDKDILICKDWALTWKVAFFDKKDTWYDNLMINEHLFLLRTNEKSLQKYLFDYLFSAEWQYALKSSITWQAQWWLNRENLLNIKISLPPLDIQQQIVDEIVILEQKEKENKEKVFGLRNTIKNKADELYSQYWLYQLWLVCESPLYWANESAISGNSKNDYRYIRITDINDNWDLNNEWVTAKKVESKYILSEWDFLFARSGATAGKTFLYKEKHGKALYAWYLIKFPVKADKLNSSFLNFILKSKRYSDWVLEMRKGTAQPNINAQQYSSFEIPLPPLEVQQHIVAQIETIESQIATLEAELAQIPIQKQALLKKYL